MKLDLLHRWWNGYRWLGDQPTPVSEGENKIVKLVVVASIYLVSAATALYVWWLAINYNPTVASVDFSSNKYNVPDMIFCPRSDFAVYPMPVEDPPVNVSEHDPIYRKRFVWWLQQLALTKRAPEHEHYEHNVWYNLRLIDLLDMPPKHVDHITALVRDPTFQYIPEQFTMYMTKMRDLFARTYEHDLALMNGTDWTAPSKWLSPVHPTLQKIIVEAGETDQKNLTLLWWALIESRYVLQYDDKDLPSELEYQAGGIWNRRFACQHDIACQQDQHAIWLDNSLCVIWIRHDKPTENSGPFYFSLDITDEIQIWVGNIGQTEVRLVDFMIATVDEYGWIEHSGRNPQHTAFTPGLDSVHITRVTPKAQICQPLTQHPANPKFIRDMFCNSTPVTSYTVFQTKDNFGNDMFATYLDSMRAINEVNLMPWGKMFGSLGSMVGMLTGLSAVKLVSSAFLSRLSPKKALTAELTMTILFLILALCFVYNEIMAMVKDRYVTEPMVVNGHDMPVPGVVLHGTPYGSRLTLNHTKLAQFGVSPSLLQYITLAATTKTHYNNQFHSEADNPVIAKYWTHPYGYRFTVESLKPSKADLTSLYLEYKQLARRLQADYNKPSHVLQYFFLDKCRIIKGCGFKDGEMDDKCCLEWDWHPTWYDSMIYSLIWTRPNRPSFSGRKYVILINTTEYTTHSDEVAPYLGPLPPEQLIEVQKHKWQRLGKMNVRLIYANSSSAAPGYDVHPLDGNFAVHNAFELSVSVSQSVLVADKVNATCHPNDQSICNHPSAWTSFHRELVVYNRCGCVPCQHNSLLRRLKPNEPCCTAAELVDCVLTPQFYTDQCPGNPSSINAYEHPTWNNMSEWTSEPSKANILTSSYGEMMGCQIWKLLAEESTETDIQCKPACVNGKYAEVQRNDRMMLPDEKHYEYLNLMLSAGSDLNIGSREYDVLQPLEILSVSWGTVTMVTGLSFLRCFVACVSMTTASYERWRILRKRRGKTGQILKFLWSGCSGSSDNSEPQAALNDEQQKSWSSAIFLFFECSLAIVGMMIVAYMVLGTYDNHVINAQIREYDVRSNQTAQLPDLMLCTKEPNVNPATMNEQLVNLKCVLQGDNTKTCQDVFPVVYSSLETFTCVLTAHPDQMITDAAVPVYEVAGLVNSSLSHFWIGDARRLPSDNELTPLYEDDVMELRYESYHIKSSSEDRQTNEASVQNKIISLQSCTHHINAMCSTSSHKDVKQYLPVQGYPSEYMEYRYFVQTPTSGVNVKHVDDDKILRVRPTGLLSYHISNKYRFNWAQRTIIVGGLADSMISISVLNLIFVIIWYVFGLRKRTMKGVVGPSSSTAVLTVSAFDQAGQHKT